MLDPSWEGSPFRSYVDLFATSMLVGREEVSSLLSPCLQLLGGWSVCLIIFYTLPPPTHGLLGDSPF